MVETGPGWSVLFAPLLWIAGTVFFDAVHWALHLMLRSGSPVLGTLAWPHAVHHAWLDRRLRTRWELQRRNVLCHLCLEYATQLAFTGVLAVALPAAPVLGCAALQTAVFGALLSRRGLDVNHRPVEILDAYRPSLFCPPAYHALHHVYPDAYFSAYTKLVDWAVGGGAQLSGRRYALAGAATPLGRALRVELERAGAGRVEAVTAPEDAARADLDVLVLCDPALPEPAWVEAFVAATRDRLLPPEVWAVHTRPDDATARHYTRDVRVSHRTLFVPDAAALDAAGARRAVRRLVSWVRRGAHFVPSRRLPPLRAFRRFRATRPVRPAAAERVRTRDRFRAPLTAAA